jgi:calcium binding protein 39
MYAPTDVMTRYIANEANLKMMMNLLRDKSKNIQFEAFHVFKVCSPTIPYHPLLASLVSSLPLHVLVT